MMKVSFKGDFKNVLVFQGKVTAVTLKGTCETPFWFNHVPKDIWEWVMWHPSVDVSETYSGQNSVLYITVTGKAKCHTGETPNPVIGERIAEARAKIRVYKFMHTLCKKLMYHYYGILYGVPGGTGELHTKVISDHQGGLQEACNKYATLWLKESQHLGKLMKDL